MFAIDRDAVVRYQPEEGKIYSMDINVFSSTFSFSCPRQCPLRGKARVVADMEPRKADAVDVLFLGVNPGEKEAELGRPFVGPAGKLLRKTAHDLLPGYVLAFSNVILCSTPNESGIANSNIAMECCARNVEIVLNAFRPRIYVPCGAKALTKFGIQDKIMTASGHGYHIDEYTIVPILHPSAVLRGCGNKSMLVDAMMTIKNFLLK